MSYESVYLKGINRFFTCSICGKQSTYCVPGAVSVIKGHPEYGPGFDITCSSACALASARRNNS